MDHRMLAGFFDELVKMANFPPPATSPVPEKPAEMKPPVAAPRIQPTTLSAPMKMNKGTNYTRSNVEAPGTDIGVGADLKSTPPPGRV